MSEEDLVRSYDLSIRKIDKAAGKIYNVGGGSTFTLSLLELLELLEKKIGKNIQFTFADWRPGDQPVYVSDISKIKKELGWKPTISVQEGTSQMIEWIVKEKDLIETVLK